MLVIKSIRAYIATGMSIVQTAIMENSQMDNLFTMHLVTDFTTLDHSFHVEKIGILSVN